MYYIGYIFSIVITVPITLITNDHNDLYVYIVHCNKILISKLLSIESNLSLYIL